MILALLAGVIGGAGIVAALYHGGMLAERSGLAVLLAAVAFFYPVFAIQGHAGWPLITLHTLVFLAFAALAMAGFTRGTAWLAGGLVLHGLFDAMALIAGHPGPAWWPAFCAALDLVAGGIIFALLHRKAIPQ